MTILPDRYAARLADARDRYRRLGDRPGEIGLRALIAALFVWAPISAGSIDDRRAGSHPAAEEEGERLDEV